MLSTDHIRGRLTGLHPSVDPGLPSRKLTPIASVACANSVEMSDVACGSPVALQGFCLLGCFLLVFLF